MIAAEAAILPASIRLMSSMRSLVIRSEVGTFWVITLHFTRKST